MDGVCDGCGIRAPLTEYTRKWGGDEALTSHLCDTCLTSIKTARYREAEAASIRTRRDLNREERAENPYDRFRPNRVAPTPLYDVVYVDGDGVNYPHSVL